MHVVKTCTFDKIVAVNWSKCPTSQGEEGLMSSFKIHIVDKKNQTCYVWLYVCYVICLGEAQQLLGLRNNKNPGFLGIPGWLSGLAPAFGPRAPSWSPGIEFRIRLPAWSRLLPLPVSLLLLLLLSLSVCLS